MKQDTVYLLAGRLLEMADDAFSCHGCNDLPRNLFDGVSHTEQQALYRECWNWLGEPEEYKPNDLDGLADFTLMGFFSNILLNWAAEKKGGEL